MKKCFQNAFPIFITNPDHKSVICRTRGRLRSVDDFENDSKDVPLTGVFGRDEGKVRSERTQIRAAVVTLSIIRRGSFELYCPRLLGQARLMDLRTSFVFVGERNGLCFFWGGANSSSLKPTLGDVDDIAFFVMRPGGWSTSEGNITDMSTP